MDRLESFALDIRFLIGLLVALFLLSVLTVALWTGLKVWLFYRSSQRSDKDQRRSDGSTEEEMAPPRATGICDACGVVPPWVYCLPDGRRLCAACHRPEAARRRKQHAGQLSIIEEKG